VEQFAIEYLADVGMSLFQPEGTMHVSSAKSYARLASTMNLFDLLAQAIANSLCVCGRHWGSLPPVCVHPFDNGSLNLDAL
jgi:hypothetical protein